MARQRASRLYLHDHKNLRPLRGLMRRGHVLGKGVIGIDIGLRMHSVMAARNNGLDPYRVMTGETISFAASFATGAYLMTFALGPAGVFLAIVLVGVAVLLADRAGRSIGHLAYDSAGMLLR